MTESSLFFAAGDFCSSVSEHHDKFAEPHHLVKLQKSIEGRLDVGRTDHQRGGGKQTGNY
jgi:hypothetical protein